MAGVEFVQGPFQGIGGAPPPASVRVEAVRDAIDLNEPGLAETYGERARLDVLNLIERLLAETRAGDLSECSTLLSHIDGRLSGLNPASLQTRRGMAGWFDSRKKRLKVFREQFNASADAMAESAGTMIDRASGLARRNQALERLWADARAAISELDAYVFAGLQRLREAADGDASHPLAGRLAALVAMRNAAIRQLPLVKVAQNADCNIPDRLQGLAAAVSGWRDEWREALGLNRKRPRKIVPDREWLMREGQALASAVEDVRRDLALAATRRNQAAARMERVAERARRAVPKT